jgi:23S rRNA (pseudouridine1915-N3)-methyltransferase
MRVVIAAVGRLKAGPERELAERYCDRAAKTGRALGINGIDVVEVRESRARDTERRILEESIALATLASEGSVTVLLDRQGENFGSDAFAGRLRSWRDNGRHTLCFMIGGADGVSAALRDRSDLILALGAATWPHQLVRIMLLEQIYRALTILSGHPYHRA